MNSEAKADQSILEACKTMEANITPAIARVRRSAAALIDNAEAMARTGRSSSDKLRAVRPPQRAAAPAAPVEDEETPSELTAKFAALRQGV